MIGVYASAAAILLASLVFGSALLHLLGRIAPTWLSGAVGFAALCVACPLLIRLPGRATTLAVLLGIALAAALVFLGRGAPIAGRPTRIGGRWRLPRRRVRVAPPAAGPAPPHSDVWIAVLVAVIVAAGASLPFLFNEREGVLGEGIYTNDQAAQLFWTDWLQHGVGPEPGAVRFGYPTGPQSVAAAAAEGTNASLLDSFNGLLVAIPVLTALVALAAFEELPTRRRVIAASLTSLPYLAASFLAQSAFKETAMALLVLAFAVTLQAISRLSREGAYQGGPHERRAMVVTLLLLAAASVFVYSLPGLVWFAVGVPIWLALEILTGGLRVDLAAARATALRHRGALVAVTIAVVAVVAFSAAQLSGFVGKVGQVQASAGRLSSPVFPGEALGIWPEGDFRVVRGEVGGAYPALALGLLAAAIGAAAAYRRRDWGLIAMGASTLIVYAGARAFASIYVGAKALAVMSPLVVLAVVYALFWPSWLPAAASRSSDEEGTTPVADRRTLVAGTRGWRDAWMRSVRRGGTGGGPFAKALFGLGVVVALAYAASTFLALRDAPVGFDQRGDELQSLAGLIQGHSVAFLGVDRFGGYWLRGTLIRSPGGYVPAEVRARPKKVWQQGLAMDFDTLSPRRLDDFEYVITTTAGYQSTPPSNFRPVVRTDSYVLWRRSGPTPPLRVIDKDGTPGRVLHCSSGAGRRITHDSGTATTLAHPVVGELSAWSRSSPFDAPGTATQKLELRPGRWRLSLQYHSQVSLTVTGPGLHVDLPASLDGMYLTHQAQGSFWPAGVLRVSSRRPVTITVSADRPSGLQRLLGVRRQVWLGPLAATRPGSAKRPLRSACGTFVDHFTVKPGTGAGPG
jgi:hypothetical protein